MSWYNLQGSVKEIKGATDLFYHDTLRIPNWPTQAAAQAHPYHLNSLQVAGIGGLVGTESQPAGQAAVGAVDAATGNLFHGLNLSAWFIRIAEILLGIALVGVGVAHLTESSNTVSKAIGIAGKVAFL